MAPLCEVDSSTTDSSREAQPEIRNAITKSETAYDAKRGIIGTNLTSDTFDASRGIRYAYIGSYAWFRSSMWSGGTGTTRSGHIRARLNPRAANSATDTAATTACSLMHRKPLTIDA